MPFLQMTSVPFLAMFLRFGVDLLGSPDIIDPRRLLLPFMAGKVRFGSDDAKIKVIQILSNFTYDKYFNSAFLVKGLKMQQVI